MGYVSGTILPTIKSTINVTVTMDNVKKKISASVEQYMRSKENMT
jgi:hypothetical protein